jgi:hypothetical protein
MFKVSYKNNTPEDISQINKVGTKQYLTKISYNIANFLKKVPVSFRWLEQPWNSIFKLIYNKKAAN